MLTFKYDTHVHTAEVSPCGMVGAKELVKLYKQAGYNGIVITDHYYKAYFESIPQHRWDKKIEVYLTGYRTALKEGKALGLQVLLGMELSFTENYNDYLVFGIDEDFLNTYKELYLLGIAEFKKLAQKMNLLVFQAHPFRTGMIQADPSNIDGLEVYNGNPRHNSYNHKAFMLAEKNQLKMTSGSDFHQVQDLARGGVVLPELIGSSREFVSMFNQGQILELIRTDE